MPDLIRHPEASMVLFPGFRLVGRNDNKSLHDNKKLALPEAVGQAVRQALRQAHGPEQGRGTHGPEYHRRALSLQIPIPSPILEKTSKNDLPDKHLNSKMLVK